MATVRGSEPKVAPPRPATRTLFAPQSPRPLRPDAAHDPALYRRWSEYHRAVRLGLSATPEPGPEIELVVVVEGARAQLLRTTLRSVAQQTSPLWHLSVTVVGTSDPELDAAVREELGAAGIFGAGRLAIRVQADGTDPPRAFAAALEESSCPALMCMDPGDELEPDAVAQLSAALLDADVAYADEDRVAPDGLACTPVLKPAWSPELLLSWAYIGRPVALRVAPLVAAGGILPVKGDWEHDLLLRVTERTQRVAHVAAVLCHRHGHAAGTSRDAADGADDPQPAAVVAALRRRGEAADVERGPLPATWTIRRRVQRRPSVSAIVPFKDSTTLLRACVDSMLSTASDVDLELVLVDNGSSEPETATLVDRLAVHADVVVRRDAQPFNWAAINNGAAAASHGEVLLFVNDDVRALDVGWLGLLAAQALRPEIGAAGARLLYPDGHVQHAGVVLGLAGASGHVLAGLGSEHPGYLGMAVLSRDVTAVTGACMATRRQVFEQLGGFDEGLGLDFNDIDYCLRARSRGLRIVFEPGAELVHHESPSRGTSGSEETASAFLARWGAAVDDGDPFFNPNLSRVDFSAALDDPGPRVRS